MGRRGSVKLSKVEVAETEDDHGLKIADKIKENKKKNKNKMKNRAHRGCYEVEEQSKSKNSKHHIEVQSGDISGILEHDILPTLKRGYRQGD